ncbi:MAG: OmpH family outer membrane protein [Nitrospiraceae bacterium]|nr:OmpH family outer membrane protein [Nitrospiraceae bacterium]
MKKTLLLVMIFVLFAGQVAYAENIKVGMVDLMKALNESDTGKKAKGELETMIKAKQSVLDQKGKEIEKLKAEIEKQSSILSAEAKKAKEDDLEKSLREYQRLVTDSQNEVKKKEGELTGGILKEIRAIISKMGEDGGYTIILEDVDGVVLFSKKDIDLTSVVIKKYNESKAKNKK